MNELPVFKSLLEKFLTPEIMKWSVLRNDFTKELRNGIVGSIFDQVIRWFSSLISKIFSNKSEAGENRWKDLHNRCIEHNIRVISKAYLRIRTQRMAEHLDLSLEEAERHLSEMVVKGAVWARIGETKILLDFIWTFFFRPSLWYHEL